MGAIGYIIFGVIIGAVVTWLMASFRLGRLGGRARGVEAVNEELRKQVQRRETEIDQVRKNLDAESQVKVEALTRLEAAQKGFEEQKALIDTMKKDMTDNCNALSSAALKRSSEDFLRLASQHLGNSVTDTKGRLGEHQTAIDGLVKPLQEALKRYEEQINALEAKRRQDYGGLEEQIKTLTSTHQQLQRETSSLVTALRKPQVSGSWGQLSLRRAAELAGMTAYCDFFEQVSVNTETGRLRPDMIVRLPNGREIVV